MFELIAAVQNGTDYTTLSWFVMGIVLILLELVIPGIIIMFFGCGALLVSLLLYCGLQLDSTGQALVFLISSLAFLALFRPIYMKLCKSGFNKNQAPGADVHSEYIGKKALVTKAIPGGIAQGQIEFKGAIWNAVSNEPVAAGSWIEITDIEGLLMHVKPCSN